TRFRETTGTCYRRLKSECLDECVLAGRFLRECFYEGGISIVNSLPASEASVESAGSLGSGQGSAELGESTWKDLYDRENLQDLWDRQEL
uniref:Uncharacterized protein n=1 Tax=Anopheles quadriannulatus TaxID=34691 RepID=A0A182X7D5_ANOQN